MQYVQAVQIFNKTSSFKIVLPTAFTLARTQGYTEEVLRRVKDAERYETLSRQGYVDEHLSKELGLFVLKMNQLAKGVI